MSAQIRLLTADDAAAVQQLRLRALQEHPTAFGSSHEDEEQRSIEAVGERLEATADNFSLGAWQHGRLIGMIALRRSPGSKVRHRAGVGGMYVAGDIRGQGIGKALLHALLARAPTLVDLEEIVLAVTVGNTTARALYLASGFKPAYIEERYLKVENRYYDLEWMSLRIVSNEQKDE